MYIYNYFFSFVYVFHLNYCILVLETVEHEKIVDVSNYTSKYKCILHMSYVHLTSIIRLDHSVFAKSI